VGVTSASGVDPAGALAAFISGSCALDNCGLLFERHTSSVILNNYYPYDEYTCR